MTVFALSCPAILYADTLSLLTHARERAYRDPHVDHQRRIESALRRLGTFAANTLGDKSQTGPDWQRFRQSNLVESMRAEILAGRIAAAALIWTRHHDEDDALVTRLPSLLSEMPANIQHEVFAPWLAHEVMPRLKRYDVLQRVETWVEQRVHKIEAVQKKPQRALALIRMMDVSAKEARENLPPLYAPATPDSAVVGSSRVVAYDNKRVLVHGLIRSLRMRLEDLVYLAVRRGKWVKCVRKSEKL